jgi:hypothetical protein
MGLRQLQVGEQENITKHTPDGRIRRVQIRKFQFPNGFKMEVIRNLDGLGQGFWMMLTDRDGNIVHHSGPEAASLGWPEFFKHTSKSLNL